nr:helix-turn-helix domain-containing protein [Kocuria palustris]
MQHLTALLTARTDAARAIMADPARSHLSMAEIAQRTGFASPAQFSRAVRGRFGTTPLRLRRDLLQSRGGRRRSCGFPPSLPTRIPVTPLTSQAGST